MKIQDGESLYDAFLPQALERALGDNDGPKVRFVARISAITGLVSLALIIVEIYTIPYIAALVSWHVVIGMIITGVLVAKLLGVLYRFVRFYQGETEFIEAGPPWPMLRVLAVPLALSTIILLGSGVELTISGPSSFSTSFLVPAHTLVAIIWFFLVALHAFAYFRRSAISSRRDVVVSVVPSKQPTERPSAARTRFLILVLAVLLGLGGAYGLRGFTEVWVNAFAHGISASRPASSLIPTRHSSYTAHEIKLAKERLARHLKDVRSLHHP
ncbi:MAG: hypothetical protein ACP5PJ_04470 [Acidimicrobiales bacterium]